MIHDQNLGSEQRPIKKLTRDSFAVFGRRDSGFVTTER